jgi:diguanylate cyclase (GGDEF)-like protein
VRLDPTSTALIVLLTCLAFGLGLMAMSRRHAPERALPLQVWARALWLAPLGWMLLELSRQYGPAWLAIPAKMLVMAGFVMLWRALRAFDGLALGTLQLLAPVAIVGIASTFWLLAWPQQPMGARILLLLCAGYAFAGARRALSASHRASSTHTALVGVPLTATALLLALRAVLQTLPEGWLLNAWISEPLTHSLVVGCALIAPAVATLGFALMDSERTLRDLRQQAETDALTGLLNRRAFALHSEPRLAGCKRQGLACALLVLDIDHFKRVNDEFGHDTGDRALRLVAASMAAQLPPSALLARIGGEEFAVLLPGNDVVDAQAIAERLRGAVRATPLPVHGQSLSLSLSVGIAALGDSSDDLSLLLRRADQAMYSAKRDGRDRVRLHAVA